MKFKELAKYFSRLEETSSRLVMTHILAELFKKISDSEIDKVLYLLQGRVTPLYERTDFGIAEKMIIKAAVLALKLDKKEFVSEYKKQGDIGGAVEKFRSSMKSLENKDLSISDIFGRLQKLSQMGGAGSQETKIDLLANLIRSLDPLSTRYIVRIPTNILRLGFSDMTILDAFSWMLKGNKNLRPEIEKAYHVRPDLGFIGKIIKTEGIVGLKNVKPRIFTPIIMMRAERLSSGVEIIEKIGRCPVEPKYDGFRLQAHFKKTGEVRLYSRNLEEVSFMYPDVIDGIKKEVHAKEIIFEGEAIGYDMNSGSFLPFQDTVQRKRKYDIEEKAKEIPLKFFAFELLFIDGENLLNIPYIERRKKLESAIKLTGDVTKDTIMIASETIVEDAKKLELLFDDAISRGLEGIIAKKIDGIYQPGARGWNWIKFKRSYSSKIDDTLDCLIMGYDLGKGKRADFGIGAFLAGVYDEKEDRFKTVAKIGTGLTDVEWRELKKRCVKARTDKKPALYDVDDMMEVDGWVKPEIVVEIKADEITKSPVHTAGRVMKKNKSGRGEEVDAAGFALRFPRLEKFRDDKRPEDVTSLKELGAMFKKQKNS